MQIANNFKSAFLTSMSSNLTSHCESKIMATDVISMLAANGVELHAFGGTVRSWIQGEIPCDIDLLSSVPVADIQKLIRNNLFDGDAVVHLDKNFQLFTWGRKDGPRLDFVQRRNANAAAKYFSEGVPVSTVGTLSEHAETFDFSVNSLIYSFADNSIIDIYDGVKDVENRILRLTRNRKLMESTPEIPLRITKFMLRGFRPVQETMHYLDNNLDNSIRWHGEKRLSLWLFFQILNKGEELEPFVEYLRGVVRDPFCREILARAAEAAPMVPDWIYAKEVNARFSPTLVAAWL